MNPAVVAHVHHDRVVAQALLLVEVVQQLADRLVEPFAHGPVPGDVDRIGLILVLVEEPGRRVVRRVRHERRVPHVERFAVLRRPVDEVEHRREALAADLQTLVAVPAASSRVAVRHALGEAAAAAGVALPPLAGLVADVALLGEQFRQRRGLVDVRDHLLPLAQELLAPGQRRVVGRDLVLVRVQPGDHRRQARPAQARRHVAALERQTLIREFVDVRRLDVRVAHERVIVPGLVVGDDHHHVRR